MKKVSFYVITTSALLTLASCFKTEKPEPEKPVVHVPDTLLTADKLIGKWDVTECYAYYFLNDELTTIGEIIKGAGTFSNGKQVGGGGESLNTFIWFEANGKFRHTNHAGEPNGEMLKLLLESSGQWKLGADSSIELTTAYPYGPVRDTTWHWTLIDSLLQVRTTFISQTPTDKEEDLVIINLIKQK